MTEGPSVAVLPLDNLSGDPVQTPIVDGMADDLITALWQIRNLFVIARNSSFAYRGKSCDMRRIAKELGVHNLIEGSVQRGGDVMRINIQIIDGKTGGHIWAKIFDGSFSEHLALQDRMAQSIADALSLRMAFSGEQAAARGETGVAAAYEAFLRGWEHYRQLTKKDLALAVPDFEEAINLDQDYGRAYAALAMIYVGSPAALDPSAGSFGCRGNRQGQKVSSIGERASDHSFASGRRRPFDMGPQSGTSSKRTRCRDYP